MDFDGNGVLPHPQNTGNIELDHKVRGLIAVLCQSSRVNDTIRHEKRADFDSVDEDHAPIVNRKIRNPFPLTHLLCTQREGVSEEVGCHQILTVWAIANSEQKIRRCGGKSLNHSSLKGENSRAPWTDC